MFPYMPANLLPYIWNLRYWCMVLSFCFVKDVINFIVFQEVYDRIRTTDSVWYKYYLYFYISTYVEYLRWCKLKRIIFKYLLLQISIHIHYNLQSCIDICWNECYPYGVRGEFFVLYAIYIGNCWKESDYRKM